MKKLILFLSTLFVLSFLKAQPIWAVKFKLSLSPPPEYVNKTDFRVYYTYLETEGKTATVNLYIQKDGKDWRQTHDKDKTAVSGYFQLEGGDFYDGQGKYNLYAKAVVEGVEMPASETVSTNLDQTPPGAVSDYSKEKKDENNYRIKFRNPSDSDFEKVYLYRSREKSFTADFGTKVGEVFGAPGESKQFDNGSLEDNKAEYYYALIALDRAGNPSGVVTDAPGKVVVGEVAGAETRLGTGGPLSYEEVEAFPEEEKVEEDQLGAGIATEAGAVEGAKTEKTCPFWWIVLVGQTVLLTVFWFLSRKWVKLVGFKWPVTAAVVLLGFLVDHYAHTHWYLPSRICPLEIWLGGALAFLQWQVLPSSKTKGVKRFS